MISFPQSCTDSFRSQVDFYQPIFHLYFRFLHASALLDLHPINQEQSSFTRLALLTPPTVPLHLSTPKRGHSFYEDVDITCDPDGIKHSFDHSMSNPTGDPISFLDSVNNSNAAQSTSAMDSQIYVLVSTTAVTEENLPEGESPSGVITPVQQGVFSQSSPFSQILQRTGGNEPNEQSSSNPIIENQPQPPVQTSSFVTSSELENLAQRLETLVNAKLQQTMTVSLPREKLPVVDSSVKRDSPGAVASSSARRIFTGSPRKRRSYRHESNTETSDLCATTSDDQAVLNKRPMPRMQLTVQMYRKHPVFKFFVTGPADSYKNPHKRRCRVCQVELSLKTKGSFAILSHYRTDAHLVREHRIR